MYLNVQTPAMRPSRPLQHARRKAGEVREQLEVASAELGLTNAVLENVLPDRVKRSSDVQRALSQNEAIEEKVQEAADELQVVTDLLQEEVAERELARRPAS